MLYSTNQSYHWKLNQSEVAISGRLLSKFNSQKIWIMRKKSRLNCEMIWKIWKKIKLNSEKIWKKIVKRFGKYGRKIS